MEEHDNFDENQYVEGFNNGYKLKDAKPELYELVVNNIKGRSDYLDGLVDGGNEHEAEQHKQQYMQALINRQRKDDMDMDR